MAAITLKGGQFNRIFSQVNGVESAKPAGQNSRFVIGPGLDSIFILTMVWYN
jgi:hypothetical protein